ncbi:hypothetical protein B0T25DRAFT_514681 [Lasiosphaeria hispida]|uniref:Uncharacterized protein n=1 Tax=Lasiosphaeria hispida TaxID=260671 RepID=A0AAJ0HPI3_9PEZI|nr:hypothetical protein B0T25DRAFT_514681 [Lasiosphaeria hispida]
MSTTPKEPKEPKELKEPKHRPDLLRQPQRKDSLSSVLTWAGLQGKPLPLKASATTSTTAPQSSQASQVQGTLKPRRHSHSIEPKKKARKSSTTSRTFSFSNPAGILEDSGAKTKHAKTLETAPKTARSGSSEKVNKTAEGRKTSEAQLTGAGQETKPPRSPPPMPKSILRVASPDGSRPLSRHIRSYSTSSPNPNPTQSPISPMASPTSPGLISPISPTFPFQPAFAPITAETEPGSQPTSPICRPMSPGATVRFAKATIHRVDVGPGRRFMPVKRRSKSTLTYISPLDPGTQPKVTLQSPTKLRRHHENQAAMGRYWMRTEEEEAQERHEMERRAAEEAERYRNEPSSPGVASPPMFLPDSPPSHESQRPSWAERLAAIDKLSPLDSIPPLDKPESEVEDKLETEEASDSEESTADSDGGASTATDKEEAETEGIEADQHGEEGSGLGIAVALEPEDTGENSGTERGADGTLVVESEKEQQGKEGAEKSEVEQKAGGNGTMLTPHAGEKTAAGTNAETSTKTLEIQTTARPPPTTAQPGTETRPQLPPAAQTESSGTKPATEKPAAGKKPGSEASQGASLTPPKAETPQAQTTTTTLATKPTQPTAAPSAPVSKTTTVTRHTTQAHTPTSINTNRRPAPLFERPTSPLTIRPSMMSMAGITFSPASPPTKANHLRLAGRRSSSRKRPAYGEEHKREITA